MNKPKPCSIRGIAYPSHAAAAAALGLTRQRIHQLAAQSQGARKKRKPSKPVAIDGVTYASVTEAASALGVSYWAARYFARLGTVPRHCKRVAAAKAKAQVRPNPPPMRNAVKIIHRIVLTLEHSIWIRRLPLPNQCAIAEARRILQQQTDLLAGQAARG